MKFIDILRIAFSTFVNNKMRTLLTVFGISIGIGAIIFLVSLGYGLQRITIGEIQSIKALKTYQVTSGDSTILSMKDDAIEKFKNINGVESVNSNLTVSGQIAYNKTKTDVIINIVGAEYLDLESPRLEMGELFSDDAEKSIVITSVIASAFNVDPKEIVGKKAGMTIFVPNPSDAKAPLMKEDEYTIKGIIKDNVASYIFLPIKTVDIPAGISYTAIKIKVGESNLMGQVKSAIVGYGYKATSIGEKIDQMNRIFQIVQTVLLAFGAIALIVASIGMFNTLTISLLERTKDIGVMKAIGATDREIYLIFLAEATLIATTGGGLGISGALILGNILNILINTLAKQAGGTMLKPFQTPVEFVLIILAFSIVVGFLTGLYPARRAAKLNPLDALRYE